MKRFEVAIPFDPARLSPNKRLHWVKASRIKKESRDLARIAWINAGRPRFDGPVDVTITVFRATPMDEDNALAGLKGCNDGLFVGALTPTDGPDWVHFQQGPTIVVSKEHKKNPCVVYRVETRDPE